MEAEGIIPNKKRLKEMIAGSDEAFSVKIIIFLSDYQVDPLTVWPIIITTMVFYKTITVWGAVLNSVVMNV